MKINQAMPNLSKIQARDYTNHTKQGTNYWILQTKNTWTRYCLGGVIQTKENFVFAVMIPIPVVGVGGV